MCWNAEVSLQSFVIGFVAVGIAYSKGLSLPMTFFCLTIVFMQLVEYVVWSYLNNPDINYTASLAGFLLLLLQPVATIFFLPSAFIPTMLMAYIGLLLLVRLFNTQTPREAFRMYRGENGHLVWNFLQKDANTFFLLLVYFFFLFGPLIVVKEWLGLGVGALTLGVSLYNFWQSNTWGSMWCWIVNYVVVGIAAKQVLVAKP